MATDTEAVKVAVTGGVYYGALAATLPADATEALDGSLTEVGYISEDGIKQSIDAKTENIKAWQNGDTVRTVQSSHEVTFEFTMIESNDDAKEIYYGQEVVSGEIQLTGEQMPEKAYVFEMLDGETAMRIVLPRARVVDRGEIVWKNDEAVAYSVTVNALPDDTGVKAYLYQEDGVTVSSIAVSPATLAISSGSANLIAIATMSDASTRNITALATWSTSNAAKATVDDYGVVTKVAAGSATISATWRGTAGTCAVTVS